MDTPKAEIKILITGPRASGKTILLSVITYALEAVGLTVKVGPNDLPAPKITMGPSPAAVAKRVIKQLGLATKTTVLIETSNERKPRGPGLGSNLTWDGSSEAERSTRKPHPLEPITEADYAVEGVAPSKLERKPVIHKLKADRLAGLQWEKDPSKVGGWKSTSGDYEIWKQRSPRGDAPGFVVSYKGRWLTEWAHSAANAKAWAKEHASKTNQILENRTKAARLPEMIGNVHFAQIGFKAVEIVRQMGKALEVKVWDSHADRTSGVNGCLLATISSALFMPLPFKLQPKAVQDALKGA